MSTLTSQCFSYYSTQPIQSLYWHRQYGDKHAVNRHYVTAHHSPTTASGSSSVDQHVMNEFTQMRSMLSSFLRQKQVTTTRTAFCNYLTLKVEGLEEKDFQTFRNKAVKLLSNIQSKAEEHGLQPQQPHQKTLSHTSSAASTFVPETFQQPQQPAPAAREYILTITETQIPSSQVIQPAQQSKVASEGQHQQSRGQLTSPQKITKRK